MTKFEKKVELYCILHGNTIDNIRPQPQQRHCDECRERNGGVCNIRYFNHQVIYESKTRKIIEKKLGRLDIKYVEDNRIIMCNDKAWREETVNWNWVCFGFLAIDEHD